ncbi:MAG: aldehyde reductase, partial [Pseudomonadales bacterium]
MGKKILVSGASGFIAGHCIIELLSHGYDVRGTVRDPGRIEELRATLSRYSDRADQVEFVEANLLVPASWEAAAEGCDGIFHVASPVPVVQPKVADEVIMPARNGTVNVLNAARNQGISRVVLTSSTAAVMSNNRTSGEYTPDDWTDLSQPGLSPYIQSKTIAERAAWDFVAEKGDLELVTVNPGMVLGPALEADYGSSLELLVILMRGTYPLLPRIGFECVDVRDVAQLHRLAFETPAAKGNRYLCGNGFRWMSDIARTIKTNYPGFNRIPSREMPNFLVKIAALFIKEVGQFVKDVDKVKRLDHSKALGIGWTPRSVEEAVVDGARSLLELGIV